MTRANGLGQRGARDTLGGISPIPGYGAHVWYPGNIGREVRGRRLITGHLPFPPLAGARLGEPPIFTLPCRRASPRPRLTPLRPSKSLSIDQRPADASGGSLMCIHPLNFRGCIGRPFYVLTNPVYATENELATYALHHTKAVRCTARQPTTLPFKG